MDLVGTSRHKRCKAARRVWKQQRLDEFDLFEAFLQTAYVGPLKFSEKVDRQLIEHYLSNVGERLITLLGMKTVEGVECWDGRPGGFRMESAAARQFRDLSRRMESVRVIDPSHDLFQFVVWQDPKGLMRVRPFGVGSLGKISQTLFREGQGLVFRDGLLHSTDVIGFPETALAQLEDMMNSRTCSEAEFQKFFETFPQLLAGLDYRQVHPQLVLFNEDGTSSVPDFILEPLDSSFCDLLELKLPYEDLVTRLRNGSRARFRAIVNEAVAQLNGYRQFFESYRNRQAFLERYGLEAYSPKMILVIGRRHHFKDDLQRRELNAFLPRDLHLWTYDDIVTKARHYQKYLSMNRR
jgi:hypothetical protein